MATLLWMNKEPEAELELTLSSSFTKKLSSKYLKMKIEDWVEGKLNSGVSDFALVGGGGGELYRMFDSYIMDNV